MSVCVLEIQYEAQGGVTLHAGTPKGLRTAVNQETEACESPRPLPVRSCPCSPGNNAAVWVMEGPVQPLSPPHPAAPSREREGRDGGGGISLRGFCLDVFISVFVFSLMGRWKFKTSHECFCICHCPEQAYVHISYFIRSKLKYKTAAQHKCNAKQ